MFSFQKPKISTNEAKINELLSRGIENVFPNREFLKSKMMKGEKLTIYLGIDPTGPTLHLGHVIPLMRLGKFQELGHQIILLMGDFTAMIGDPTDKNATRRKLSQKEVLANLKEYHKQASRFISFSGSNKAMFKFNSEWLAKMNFGDVLELASLMTVDQMLKRDMFAKRREAGEPIYIHEFLYPLMQGYDSVAMDVDGEIGGNDQTFNMLAGRDLMKSLKNKEKFVVATKLIVDPTGRKMGKTENNMVALNQSPEEMFGKVMSWDDELISPGFELVTGIAIDEIELIKKSLNSGDNPKKFKLRLAKEIVTLCYGEKSAKEAEENFEKTFSKGGVPDEVSEVVVAKETLLVDILLAEKIVSSKTEWRRLIEEGAVTNMDTSDPSSRATVLEQSSVHGEQLATGRGKITDPEIKAMSGVYKIGKRRFIKIKVL